MKLNWQELWSKVTVWLTSNILCNVCWYLCILTSTTEHTMKFSRCGMLCRICVQFASGKQIVTEIALTLNCVAGSDLYLIHRFYWETKSWDRVILLIAPPTWVNLKQTDCFPTSVSLMFLHQRCIDLNVLWNHSPCYS